MKEVPIPIEDRIRAATDFRSKQAKNNIRTIESQLLTQPEYDALDHGVINLRMIQERKEHLLTPDQIDGALLNVQEKGLERLMLDRLLLYIGRDGRTVNDGYYSTMFISEVSLLRRAFIRRGNGEIKKLEDLLGEEWGLKDRMPKINGVTPLGLYNPNYKKIQLVFDTPTAADVIGSLARGGILPLSVEVHAHENIHAAQHILGGPNIPRELLEEQAYRAEFADRLSHDALVTHIKSSPAYAGFEKRKLDYAVWMVDRMNALRFSQRQIIDSIASSGKWNEDFGLWEGIEERYKQALHDLSLDSTGVEHALLVGDIRRGIAVNRASYIAQHALYDFAPKNSSSRMQSRPPLPPQRAAIMQPR